MTEQLFQSPMGLGKEHARLRYVGMMLALNRTKRIAYASYYLDTAYERLAEAYPHLILTKREGLGYIVCQFPKCEK